MPDVEGEGVDGEAVEGEVVTSKPNTSSLRENQTGGLTDNLPIYLAHSVPPSEGEAKVETR